MTLIHAAGSIRDHFCAFHRCCAYPGNHHRSRRRVRTTVHPLLLKCFPARLWSKKKGSKQQWKSLHAKCFQLGGSPGHAKLLSSLPGNPTSSSDPSHLRELRDDGSRRTPAPASTAPAAAPAAAVGTPAAAAGGDSILMGSQLETTINGVCHIP